MQAQAASVPCNQAPRPLPHPAAEEEESFGLAALLPPGLRKEKKKVDIKGRMASILSQASALPATGRRDGWHAPNQHTAVQQHRTSTVLGRSACLVTCRGSCWWWALMLTRSAPIACACVALQDREDAWVADNGSSDE